MNILNVQNEDFSHLQILKIVFKWSGFLCKAKILTDLASK